MENYNIPDLNSITEKIKVAWIKANSFDVFALLMEKVCDWESLSYSDIWMIMWKLLNKKASEYMDEVL